MHPSSSSFCLLPLLEEQTLSWMISPEMYQKSIRGLLQLVNNSVINRILIFLKPSSDIVGYNASIVNDGKVSIFISLGLRLGNWW